MTEDGSVSTSTTRNVLLRMEKSIMKRLFEINYVMVSNQIVGQAIYQVIMLAEFLQLLFFVFYQMVFMNRFALNTAQYTLESSLAQNTNTS